MESGKEGSAPPPTPKSGSRLGFSGGIKKWLEKRGLLKPGYSRQKALSESVPGLSGDSGEQSSPLSTAPTAERLVKPEIPMPGVAPIPEGNIRLFHFTLLGFTQT